MALLSYNMEQLLRFFHQFGMADGAIIAMAKKTVSCCENSKRFIVAIEKLRNSC